jgi:hypothetical protein
MSPFDRLIGVLFDPQPAFADIAARPAGWWVPLVLLGVLSASFIVSFGERVGWERFFRQQAAQNERFQQMPAEQREQILEQQAKWAGRLSPVFALLSWPVSTLVLTGVFMLVFNVLLGAETTFRPAFAATSYALLPLGIRTAVAGAVMFLKDPADFELEHPLATDVGTFLDPTSAPRWLQSVGSSLDLFYLWTLILLALAYAAVGRRLTFAKSLTWVAATWVLYLVGKGLVVWIFS